MPISESSHIDPHLSTLSTMATFPHTMDRYRESLVAYDKGFEAAGRGDSPLVGVPGKASGI